MAGLLSATLLACAVASQAQNGQWRVLQMSLNLPQFEQTNVRETLMETAPTLGGGGARRGEGRLTGDSA